MTYFMRLPPADWATAQSRGYLLQSSMGGPADFGGACFLVVPAAIDLENVSVLEGGA